MPLETHLEADQVREVARGRWRYTIYPALGIEVGTGEHRACPFCGGRDRFRCDDQDGSGSWYCNQCEPHAGDGFALVKNVLGCDFPESLRRVAGVLSITPSLRRPSPQPVLKSKCLIRRQRANTLELHALLLKERAEATLNTASGRDCSQWTDCDFDGAMDAVARVQEDLAYAEVLFDAVDYLRERAFLEEQAAKSTKENR